uniref:Uncharacterized protein n=1 Tax=Hyaloperonospora arabidopsidis (strain Emoy2) TaxID=559515 RepID=M4BTV3_HYAAE
MRKLGVVRLCHGRWHEVDTTQPDILLVVHGYNRQSEPLKCDKSLDFVDFLYTICCLLRATSSAEHLRDTVP